MVRSPLSLYFHIPFCTRKCPYCHFFVVPNTDDHREAFLDALFIEWKRIFSKIKDHLITSIYFGGGTPTLLGASAIHTLLQSIPFSSDCEITIEANPEDVTEELMEQLKQAGINRVSLGVQSLDDSSLLVLERTHDAKKAIEAILWTKNAGISNISIDLMYELPNQTQKSFERTLGKLEALPITHLSLYNLTIEPNTAFFKRTLNLPSPEENVMMLQTAIAHLENMGLKRYEISAFARPGFSSRHNVGYWTNRPFFGLGPSAFSYYEGKRFRNIPHLHRYIRALRENRSAIDFIEELPYPQNVHERLVIQLRMLEGVDLDTLDLPEPTHALLDKLQAENYLERKGSLCKLTAKGILFYDTVATEII